jgi:NDP-sugar pyrophosphorylase family protein
MGLPAFILAGGRGSRLKELTDHVPKPLHSLNNRTILDNLIQALEDAAATPIMITCSYLGDVMARYVIPRYPRCRMYPTSTTARTPLDALLELHALVAQDFVVVHGDHWFSENPFRDLFQRHHQGEVTFLIEKPANSLKSGYDSRCLFDTRSSKIDYLASPKTSTNAESETVRIVDGCYALPKEIFGMIRALKLEISKKPKKKGKRREDGMRELFRYVAHHQLATMRGVFVRGWWENINDLETAGKTHRRILDELK